MYLKPRQIIWKIRCKFILHLESNSNIHSFGFLLAVWGLKRLTKTHPHGKLTPRVEWIHLLCCIITKIPTPKTLYKLVKKEEANRFLINYRVSNMYFTTGWFTFYFKTSAFEKLINKMTKCVSCPFYMSVCLFAKGNKKTGKSELKHLPEGPYYLKYTMNVLVAFSTEYMGKKM